MVLRWPLIMTRCIMSLIRGGALLNFPCPVCLVRCKELTILTKTWPLRTAVHTHQLIEEARGLLHAQHERLLASQGLRDLDVNLPLFHTHLD
jgi:hypothetical protein